MEDISGEIGLVQKSGTEKYSESRSREVMFHLFLQLNFRLENIIILKPRAEYNSTCANAVDLKIKTKDKRFVRSTGRSAERTMKVSLQS